MYHYIYRSILITYGLIIDPHNNQFPVGLIAQLVEHCTSIAGARFESCSSLRYYISRIKKTTRITHFKLFMYLNRVIQDHEAHASAINRKWTFVFFVVFSKLKLPKYNKQGPISAVQQSPQKLRLLVANLNFSNNAIFWRLFGFDFNFIQFPSVKSSDILRPDRVWQNL